MKIVKQYTKMTTGKSYFSCLIQSTIDEQFCPKLVTRDLKSCYCERWRPHGYKPYGCMIMLTQMNTNGRITFGSNNV